MTFRRSLAVAATVTVAAPLALITAAPAFAAGTSAGPTQNQPTYADLVNAAADAQQAYDAAVTAEAEGRKEVEATLKALDSDTHPLKAAVIAAEKAAKEAAATKDAAEKAVADAKARLEAAQGDTDKAEAQRALETAEGDLAKAVAAQQEADAAAQQADTALDDARVAAVRKYGQIKKALDEARAAKEAADKALATAKECVRETGLTSLAVGLPAKVAAGSTVDFTVRVTNGTQRTLAVDPLVFFHVAGETRGAKSLLKVEWSNGTAWQALSGEAPQHIAHIDIMKPGEHSDVKLRMKVDSAARNADAFALLASDASDAYNPCVLGPMKRYDIKLLPAGSKTGPADDAKPGRSGQDEDKRPGAAKPGKGSGLSAQGGASQQVTRTTATEAGAEGNLAETGSSSAMAPIALTSAAAVVLGAGAVVAARRRKSTRNV
ncbi:LAETG motif-containing sortase-dependent surface protein [Streptomyces sp. NPDC014006]|uniref:LAETG motif-containing sortase-dependent surface protein n=1 Tax=Streptomyces sp. NPDC014006 TaxID=3364870 RepID=UPI0036F98DA0